VDYSTIFNHIERPTRYLGGEPGSVVKNPEEVELRIALAFPDAYEIGMSNLGLAILYQILNDRKNVAAERVYTPWPDMEEWLRQEELPLTSLETARPLHTFDVVGFSLPYELCYTNIFNMMQLGGIPWRSCDRTEDMPIVIGGGSCAFNPEPVADFFDAIVVGDGEEAVLDIVDSVLQSRAENLSRKQKLVRLAAIDGVYVPSLYQPEYSDDGFLKGMRKLEESAPAVIKRRFLKNLDTAPGNTRPVIPFMQTVHNRVTTEIARGCTRGCRFCQAGYIYRPVRERSPQTILDMIEDSIRNSGHSEISLLSLSTGDYGCIEPLLKELMVRYSKKRIAVSFPSLRVGSMTGDLMEEIRKVRKTGLTLAPEAGSERMRTLINKGISADDLMDTVDTAFNLGWRRVKLYFMIGLPGERKEDLTGIVDLCFQVKQLGKQYGGRDLTASASTFIPKPHTPFQWEAQINVKQTLEKQRYLRGSLQKRKIRLRSHGAEMSLMEGVFSRGDRRLGVLLEEAHAAGCRFDGWQEHFDINRWLVALDEAHIDRDFYLRSRDLDEVLPWDHIDCGIPKSYFREERDKAFALIETPDCRDNPCSDCGVCDFKQLKMDLVHKEVAFTKSEHCDEAVDASRCKIRLTVSKTGKARFIGHLEFLSIIHRAIRRAELPVRYSQGFHPVPKVSFSDALPSGMESLAEIIDMELVEKVDPVTVGEQLNKALPMGIHVQNVEEVGWKTASPSGSIENVEYLLKLEDSVCRQDLCERIETFLAMETLSFDRPRGGRTVCVDLRPDVISVALTGDRLEIRMRKGNPLYLCSWLLQLPAEKVRGMELKKVAVSANRLLPDTPPDLETEDGSL